MARLLSYKAGAIKSTQTVYYRSSTDADENVTFTINAIDTSKSYVVGTSAYDSGNGTDIAVETRQVYINSSTELLGRARNSAGETGDLYSAGGAMVVEMY